MALRIVAKGERVMTLVDVLTNIGDQLVGRDPSGNAMPHVVIEREAAEMLTTWVHDRIAAEKAVLEAIADAINIT